MFAHHAGNRLKGFVEICTELTFAALAKAPAPSRDIAAWTVGAATRRTGLQQQQQFAPGLLPFAGRREKLWGAAQTAIQAFQAKLADDDDIFVVDVSASDPGSDVQSRLCSIHCPVEHLLMELCRLCIADSYIPKLDCHLIEVADGVHCQGRFTAFTTCTSSLLRHRVYL